jgi:hypothetical protein
MGGGYLDFFHFQHILIWAYLFTPNSDFDDLGLYGKLVE